MKPDSILQALIIKHYKYLIMKYIFSLVLCLGILATTSTRAYGQEENKTVIIIKKTIDENGKTTTKRQEATGKEADALIKKMKEDGTLEGIDVDIEIEKAKPSGSIKKEKKQSITVGKSIIDGKEWTTYKIVTEENGEKEVMEWSGEGEMPAEMAEKLKNVNIKTRHISKGKEIMIMVEDDEHDGSKKPQVYTFENKKMKKKHNNKVTLGIMIEDDSQGVIVSDIIKDSAAAKCGLKNGDIILKINEIHVFNTEMLLKALSLFDKGDKANVTYLRDGKEKKTNAKF